MLAAYQCPLDLKQNSFILHDQVAFASYYVVDNGETAVATGLRSSLKYRNQGLVSKAKAVSLEAAMVKFPNLKYQVSAVRDSVFYDQYRCKNSKNICIANEKVRLYIFYSNFNSHAWGMFMKSLISAGWEKL